ALRTVGRLAEVEEADRWSASLLGTGDESDGAVPEALDDFLAHHPPLTPTFVSRFLRQLRLADRDFTSLAWLEPWMAEEGVSAEDAAARANERLALTQVTTANSITSLRAIGRLDWKAFVERQSVMEGVLRTDPSGVYSRMTFATRDAYRHVVERIAKRTNRREREVAEAAVALAAGGARA